MSSELIVADGGVLETGSGARALPAIIVLTHTAEVDDYLRARELQTTDVRQANERLFSSAGIRTRLLARQDERGSA